MIFFGLGGAFAPEAALANGNVSHVMVIDFDINGIAELFCSKDYVKIMEDPRFSLWVDPDAQELKNFILEQYRPVICGGIRTIPLRTRTVQDTVCFDSAATVIKEVIEKVSADYSVQAHFGIRWFSNIIRNLKMAEAQSAFCPQGVNVPAIREAVICAAGPSLDIQMPMLAEQKRKGAFIISSDTAFPALLHSGIEPDAVVSIDCQHISYYHFKGLGSRNIPFFLDIASPPLLSQFSVSPFFFCGGHPLALYACRFWRPLPQLDTSGGNVTYTCLSLAENLGAQRITLFGCDFSYPAGRTYARGTYVYPYFTERQNRFAPVEAQHSSFLYRSPFLPCEEKKNYYETASLSFYRRGIEEKAAKMEAEITAVRGMGAVINLPKKKQHSFTGENYGNKNTSFFTTDNAKMSYADFLEQYRKDISALPLPAANGTGSYWQSLDEKSQLILATVLPLAAAVKHRNSGLQLCSLIEEVKCRCIAEIDAVLS